MDHYNNDRKLKKRFLEAERTRDAARRKRSYEEFGKTKNLIREAATHVWDKAHQADRLLKQTALRQAIRALQAYLNDEYKGETDRAAFTNILQRLVCQVALEAIIA